MADRYWVAGGDGNWNSTTNWSATSGGASGASIHAEFGILFLGVKRYINEFRHKRKCQSGSGCVFYVAGSNPVRV